MPEETPKQRQVELRTPPEGLVRIYSNNVSVASTRFDVRILFGEVNEITDDKAIVENKVQVTMTWLEAKLVADFLNANVKAYEELNGPMKLPKIPEKMIVPQTFPEPE